MSHPYYLAIQSSYHTLSIALYRTTTCIEQRTISDGKASSHLILHLQQLLDAHGINLSSITFICIDAGPGAFTSLRVAIASINGIGFSHKVPLIGVYGLQALLNDSKALPLAPEHILCILNAYGNDAYFISSINGIVTSGCKKIHDIITDVQTTCPQGTILITGNGVKTYADELSQAFGDRMLTLANIPHVASVQAIAELGYKQWLTNEPLSYKIEPIYLKTQLFAIKKS